MKLLKLIKEKMAQLHTRRFVPTQEEREKGAEEMSQTEILDALIKYKAQNPVKYKAKKEALFARYGLDINDEPEELQDEETKELEELQKKVAKKVAKKAVKKAVKKTTKKS